MPPEWREYQCDWPNCGHKFLRNPDHTGGNVDQFGALSDGGWDAITCPSCGNGLKVDGDNYKVLGSAKRLKKGLK